MTSRFSLLLACLLVAVWSSGCKKKGDAADVVADAAAAAPADAASAATAPDVERGKTAKKPRKKKMKKDRREKKQKKTHASGGKEESASAGNDKAGSGAATESSDAAAPAAESPVGTDAAARTAGSHSEGEAAAAAVAGAGAAPGTAVAADGAGAAPGTAVAAEGAGTAPGTAVAAEGAGTAPGTAVAAEGAGTAGTGVDPAAGSAAGPDGGKPVPPANPVVAPPVRTAVSKLLSIADLNQHLSEKGWISYGPIPGIAPSEVYNSLIYRRPGTAQFVALQVHDFDQYAQSLEKWNELFSTQPNAKELKGMFVSNLFFSYRNQVNALTFLEPDRAMVLVLSCHTEVCSDTALYNLAAAVHAKAR